MRHHEMMDIPIPWREKGRLGKWRIMLKAHQKHENPFVNIKNPIYVLFIRSHLVQSINKNWYLFLFVKFFLSSFERASLQHQNNSRGSGICRNLCSAGALIQLPMRANLVDGGKQIAPGILGLDILLPCKMSVLDGMCFCGQFGGVCCSSCDIFFADSSKNTGVSTVASGK